MSGTAGNPEPPYYAAIFSSKHSDDISGYAATADRMEALAKTQPGFLGIESARGADGFGITVSYWESEAAIAAWKANAEHLSAQKRGKRSWYTNYVVRIAKVERAYQSG